MFTKFVGDQLTKKNVMNQPKGNEFFLPPLVVDGRLQFEAPHGCYSTTVKFYDGKMVETREELLLVFSCLTSSALPLLLHTCSTALCRLMLLVSVGFALHDLRPQHLRKQVCISVRWSRPARNRSRKVRRCRTHSVMCMFPAALQELGSPYTIGFVDIKNKKECFLSGKLPGKFRVEQNYSQETAHIVFLNAKTHCSKQFAKSPTALLGPAGNVPNAKTRKAQCLKAGSVLFLSLLAHPIPPPSLSPAYLFMVNRRAVRVRTQLGAVMLDVGGAMVVFEPSCYTSLPC